MSRNGVLHAASGLQQLDSGIWYMEPVPEEQAVIYNRAYFDRFKAYHGTPMSVELQAFRVGVAGMAAPSGAWLDFGAGAGSFVRAARAALGADCMGFDVNRWSERALRKLKAWADPRDPACPTRYIPDAYDLVTFFDSLEHVRRPALALRIARKAVIVTLPIFQNIEHLLGSKHLKPSEHVWYFTDAGFRVFMRWHGFEPARRWTNESDIGREDVCTYYCVRTEGGKR